MRGIRFKNSHDASMYNKGYEQGISYDRERIVSELEKIEEHCLEMSDLQCQSAIEKSIEIARGGENDWCYNSIFL